MGLDRGRRNHCLVKARACYVLRATAIPHCSYEDFRSRFPVLSAPYWLGVQEQRAGRNQWDARLDACHSSRTLLRVAVGFRYGSRLEDGQVGDCCS